MAAILLDNSDDARKNHIAYFARCLEGLSHHYESLDFSRMTLIYFCVVALDLLGGLESVVDDGSPNGGWRARIVDWIYNCQVTPSKGAYSWRHCGFRGGPYFGQPFESADRPSGDGGGGGGGGGGDGSAPRRTHEYDHGHIAMTYSALAALLTLGDDLSRVDRAAVVRAMGALQRPDGCFTATSNGSECDMRFLYCACAISTILDDWSGIDCDRAVQYVRRCMSYDGGIGLVPGQESHGGSTFTATAALKLMGRVDELEYQGVQDLEQWCLRRQLVPDSGTSADADASLLRPGAGGFQGRCNKDADTCYSFWIGGTLAVLGAFDLVDTRRLVVQSRDRPLFTCDACFSLAAACSCAHTVSNSLLVCTRPIAWANLWRRARRPT